MPYTAQQFAITSTGIVTIFSSTGDGPTEYQIQMTSGTAYLGAVDVTSSGYAFTTGDERMKVTLFPGDALYAISTQAVLLRALKHYQF